MINHPYMAFLLAFMLARYFHLAQSIFRRTIRHVLPCRNSTLSSAERHICLLEVVFLIRRLGGDSSSWICCGFNSFMINFCFSLSATHIHSQLASCWIFQIDPLLQISPHRSSGCRLHKRTRIRDTVDGREDSPKRRTVAQLRPSTSSNLLTQSSPGKGCP